MGKVTEVVLAVGAGIFWGTALFVTYVARVSSRDFSLVPIVIVSALGASLPIYLAKVSRRERRSPRLGDAVLFVADGVIAVTIAVAVIVGLVLQNLGPMGKLRQGRPSSTTRLLGRVQHPLEAVEDQVEPELEVALLVWAALPFVLLGVLGEVGIVPEDSLEGRGQLGR